MVKHCLKKRELTHYDGKALYEIKETNLVY